MQAEKLSISLPFHLAHFVADYQHQHACKNRSEVIQQAIKLLQQKELERHYRLAAEDDDEENNLFEVTVADGLSDETW